MQPRTTKMQRAFSVFILAGLVLTAACSKNQDLSILPPDQSAAMQEIPALKKQPASTTTAALPDAGRKSETPCTASACPSLVVMQSGKPARIDVSSRGLLPAASLAIPKAQTQNGRWIIDTGTSSPDGKWVAYTSIGTETGGPVLLQNLQTGEWTNLLQTVNAHLPEGQSPLQENYWWDVIGWFPDSAQLMIGPSDLSMVTIVDLTTYAARQIGFPGGGRGGRLFVNLASDGSRFLFVKDDSSGNQVISAFDLSSGHETELLKAPLDQGAIYNPRFSPDQKQIAYLVQKLQSKTSMAYSIHLLSSSKKQPHQVIAEKVGMTVPVWSPDGRAIAFTRAETGIMYAVGPKSSPQPEHENIWIVLIADGKQSQVTFLDGSARSPVWANDSKTLAFVTQDGQVEMANIEQPGKVWQAAAPSQNPELTSVFFLP